MIRQNQMAEAGLRVPSLLPEFRDSRPRRTVKHSGMIVYKQSPYFNRPR
jgi:hypothetical protein